MNNIFTWGMSVNNLKEQFPDTNITSVYGILYIENISLSYFESDCGTVVLGCASYLNEESWEVVKYYCTNSGYSTILATICSNNTHLKMYLDKLTSREFKILDSGQSNRNPNKTHHILCYRFTPEEMVKHGY